MTAGRRCPGQTPARALTAARRCAKRTPARALTAATVLVLLGAAAALGGCDESLASSAVAASSSAAPSSSPTVALRVLATRPRSGSTGVSFSTPLAIRFSTRLAAGTPHPRLLPRVAGTWTIVDGTTFVFRPAHHWPLLTTVRVVIPRGSAGVRSAQGATLTGRSTSVFSVRGGSVLRLQELLAATGYLPLRFRAAASSTDGSADATGGSPVSPATLRGHFSWRYPRLRSVLAAWWRPGRSTVLVQGAVMAFEADQGLSVDGAVDARFWATLLTRAARAHPGRHPYDCLEVTTSLPETLRIWRNGRVVFSTPVNTGIASRPTPDGAFTVYLRYLSTTMSGTNPDGSRYEDRGVPYVAYFHAGCAVHGFERGSYGYPQSLGCVELPYAAAKIVYGYDPLGTIVVVH